MNKTIVFPQTPFIYRYIQYDYNQAETEDELIELLIKWDRVINYTNNPVKKEAFQDAYNTLYSELSNKALDNVKLKQL